MFKTKYFIILFILIYTLDSLYLLPLSVPLDTKPDSRRSATYLAKSIAKEAKCEDVWLLDINYIKGDTMLSFDCTYDRFINFSIHVFLNDKKKNEYINKDNNYEMCFKEGLAYIVCESGILPNKINKPIFRGKKYYKNFL